MAIRPVTLISGLLLALTFVVLPTRAEAQGGVTVHRVVISLDQNGSLRYSLNPVIAYPGDRVVFSAPGMDSWTVTFQGQTPFQNRVIGGTGSDQRNVPILPTAATGRYKYDVSVTVDGRTVTEDPDIIVRGRGMP